MKPACLIGLGVWLVTAVAQATTPSPAPVPSVPPAPAPPPVSAMWPGWQHFSESFVQDDGRVVDWTSDARTVSEGQAYALFFSLVANDRARFDRVLAWTQENLAQGDLHSHLPSWLWGADDKHRWGVLDINSASDADLWLAYDLLEAGRLWKRSDYTASGHAVLAQVAKQEVRQLRKLTVLMPGPLGFDTPDGIRLNPSYVVAFQMSYFAQVDPKGPWSKILADYLGLLPELAPSGCVPDWFILTDDGPRKDQATDGRGGYDAIRVYLWAGIMPTDALASPRLRKSLAPFVDFIRKAGRLPEHWFPDGRAPDSMAPAGIETALMPFYSIFKADDLLDNLGARLTAETAAGLVGGRPARYYEQALTVFGEGWMEHRYRFDRNGRLLPQWAA